MVGGPFSFSRDPKGSARAPLRVTANHVGVSDEHQRQAEHQRDDAGPLDQAREDEHRPLDGPRQPEQAGTLRGTMILLAALVEGAALIAVVFCLVLALIAS